MQPVSATGCSAFTSSSCCRNGCGNSHRSPRARASSMQRAGNTWPSLKQSVPCMAEPHFALALPMHLIQALRLAQALMESDAIIHVSHRHAPKFDYLREFFDFEFAVGEEGLPVLAGASVSHEEPLTRIGGI